MNTEELQHIKQRSDTAFKRALLIGLTLWAVLFLFVNDVWMGIFSGIFVFIWTALISYYAQVIVQGIPINKLSIPSRARSKDSPEGVEYTPYYNQFTDASNPASPMNPGSPLNLNSVNSIYHYHRDY